LYKIGVLSELFCFIFSSISSFCRCQGDKKDLDGDLSKLPRTRELTEMLVGEWSVSDLWDKFGIVSDIVVRTEWKFLLFDVVTNSILIKAVYE
jgi:hypothetical protein